MGEIAGGGRRRGSGRGAVGGGLAGEVGLRGEVQGHEAGRTKAVHGAGGERGAAFGTGRGGRKVFVHHLFLRKRGRGVTGFVAIHGKGAGLLAVSAESGAVAVLGGEWLTEGG